MNEFMREKKCAVIGLARAGVPAARFLAERGNRVVGYDSKTREQLLPEVLELENLGVKLQLGAHEFAGLLSCNLIVLSPGVRIHHEPLAGILEKARARGVEIIGELELAARHCPAPMIAVTGTKGKSTTVKLITELLQACGQNALRAGNTGTPLIAELPHLSPASWAVVEVSSFQLERAPTFKPRIAVLLNLLPDHQDYHTSLDQYWQTKLRIFAHQKAGDTAICNLDDTQTQLVIENQNLGGQAQLLGVSGRNWPQLKGAALGGAGVQNGQLGWMQNGAFEALIANEDIALSGEHNRANVAAAICAVMAALGAEQVLAARTKLAQVIRDFESLPHRLELVAEKNGVRWINDSQATIPEAAIAALHAFETPIALIAGGKNKLDDPAAYDALGRAVAERADYLFCIGETASIIANAAQRAGMAQEKIIEAGTLQNAVRAAKERMKSGTVVMSPACASFDQFKSFEDRGAQFRHAVDDLGALQVLAA